MPRAPGTALHWASGGASILWGAGGNGVGVSSRAVDRCLSKLAVKPRRRLRLCDENGGIVCRVRVYIILLCRAGLLLACQLSFQAFWK